MVLRNFVWDDVPALATLKSKLGESGDSRPAIDEIALREYLSQPNLEVTRDLFLYTNSGVLTGYALIHSEPPIRRSVLELGIHSKYDDGTIHRELIKAALNRAKENGSTVLHYQTSQEPASHQLLSKEGFIPVRVYWIMRRDTSSIPFIIRPPEFSIRSFQDPKDIGNLMRIQNAAFQHSWGFSPNNFGEISYRTRMSSTNPEGILLLCNPSAVVGYCWTSVIEKATGMVGVISMIGIDPSWREQRLSRPLLHAGLTYLSSCEVDHVELEVDSQNLAAVGLYHSMGFEKVAERQWFEASVQRSPR